MFEHGFNIKELYPSIYQIEEYRKVNCTLIKGTEKAILWDMGYGVYNLKKQIEKMIDTPLIVIASHGHPDHTLGCFQFDTIYLSPNDKEIFKESNSLKNRKRIAGQIERRGVFTEEDSKKYIKQKLPEIKEITIGTQINLGNIHAEVIDLKGHTKGSIGLLLKEPKILLTGDAICNDLWLFLPESESIKTNIKSIENTFKLPFDYFIAAHKQELYPKAHIQDILDNLKNLSLENSRELRVLKNYDVYESRVSTPYGDSSILYVEDKLD